MRRTTSGFTIVEVLVVVSIVGLLATISTVSFSSIKSRANDAERSSKITILAEALEKFYDENGEYPGCNAMSQAASVITTSTLDGVDLDVLATPTASTGTNSILSLCGDLPIGIDSYAYVGDSSEACLTGEGCTQFTLKYREESTGHIIALQSRRSPFVRAPETPTTTVTLSGANVLATIKPVTCTSGTIQYGIRSRTNDGTWSAYTAWSSTTTATQVATQGIKYGYQAQARCWVSDSLTSWASTGLEGTYSHPVVTPAAPAIAVTLSGSNILATITPVSCSAGTAQYGIRSRTNDGSWSSYSAWSTGLTTTLPAVGATKYGFQAQARCYVSEFGISPTSTGAEGTYIVAASSAPSIAVTSNVSTITGTITAVSCPVGTTQYQIRSRTNDGSWSGWSSWSTTLTATQSASQGVKYGYQAQSRCYISDYAYSTTSTGSEGTYTYIVAVSSSAPSIAVTSNGSTITGTITAVSCPVGTTQYQIRSRTNDGSWSGWSSWSTTLTATQSASQGVKYGYQAQSRCYISDYAYSTTSTGSEGTYVQGINVPAAPSVWNSTPNWADTNYGWGGSSCPSGTTLRYAYYYWRADGWNSGWIETGGTSASYSTSHFGWWYNLQAMARCYSSYTTSGWSGANSTSFTRPGPPSVRALVVAGGGGGGNDVGGGGGAGGLVDFWAQVGNGGHGIGIGGGGSGAPTNVRYWGNTGGNSSVFGTTALGGGGGGPSGQHGNPGGSGGGGGGTDSTTAYGNGNQPGGYANHGGIGHWRNGESCGRNGVYDTGGGGGGATQIGSGAKEGDEMPANKDPQDGGNGYWTDISGSGNTYAGGGGGGGHYSGCVTYWGEGGAGGGGNGSRGSGVRGGDAHYYGGGGGGGSDNLGGGGNGYQGIVIIRYASAWWWAAGGGNGYWSGSDFVHSFGGNDTFTVYGFN